jgi:hypothetical protein
MRLFNFWSNKIDPDTFLAYKSAIPSTIDVNVKHAKNRYVATVKTIEHEALPKDAFLITEANSTDELVDMVNDLIFTYKRIPESYRPYYKQILKPEGSVSRSEELRLVKAA